MYSLGKNQEISGFNGLLNFEFRPLKGLSYILKLITFNVQKENIDGKTFYFNKRKLINWKKIAIKVINARSQKLGFTFGGKIEEISLNKIRNRIELVTKFEAQKEEEIKKISLKLIDKQKKLRLWQDKLDSEREALKDNQKKFANRISISEQRIQNEIKDLKILEDKLHRERENLNKRSKVLKAKEEQFAKKSKEVPIKFFPPTEEHVPKFRIEQRPRSPVGCKPLMKSMM